MKLDLSTRAQTRSGSGELAALAQSIGHELPLDGFHGLLFRAALLRA